MLGLKRYKNYTLDLWVGKEEDFFCDLMIFLEVSFLEKKREALETITLKKEDILEEVIFSRQNLRHLVFVCHFELDTESFLADLKKILDFSKLPEKLKRITFITESLEKYDQLHEKISEIF
jgi:hypothetical protein